MKKKTTKYTRKRRRRTPKGQQISYDLFDSREPFCARRVPFMCGSFFHFPAEMKRPDNGRRQCPNGGTGRREEEVKYPLTDARRVRNETRPTRTRVCDIFHFVVFVFNIYRSLFLALLPLCSGVLWCRFVRV